jgi:hypothetical protein
MTQEITYQDVKSIGETFAKSGYFQDAREAAQAIVKIMAGRELGIGPVASMAGVYIVKGKPALSANMLAGVLKRSGKYDYRVITLTDEACEIAFFQGAQEIGRSLFAKADAVKAGTQNMDKFARNMLFARAMTNGIRWYCPDVFAGGVYTPEELGERTDGETGEVITGRVAQVSVVETIETSTPEPVKSGPVIPELDEYERVSAVTDHKGNAYIGKPDEELAAIANNAKAPQEKRDAASTILRHRHPAA